MPGGGGVKDVMARTVETASRIEFPFAPSVQSAVKLRPSRSLAFFAVTLQGPISGPGPFATKSSQIDFTPREIFLRDQCDSRDQSAISISAFRVSAFQPFLPAAQFCVRKTFLWVLAPFCGHYSETWVPIPKPFYRGSRACLRRAFGRQGFHGCEPKRAILRGAR